MYIMTAVYKNIDNNTKSYSIYDLKNNEMYMLTEEETVAYLKEKNTSIRNLGLDEDGKLVGTQGSIDRYAVFTSVPEVGKKYPIIIINKEADGYNVIDCMGKSLKLSEAHTLQYAKQFGIANAKIVKKGDTEFISAISGTFELVGGRLSDDIKAQWNRLQSLKIEGKLSARSAALLDSMEPEYNKQMQRLHKSELRHGVNGVFDIARMNSIIYALSEIIDEIDIDRVDEMQKKVSKQFKELKSLGRSKRKTMTKEQRNKFDNAMKIIGTEFRKTIRLVEEEEISSDECIRKFEVISKHLAKITNSLDK